MPKKQCLSEIKRKYSVLTSVEKKIADYVLKNPSKVVNMSVRDISKEADVVNSAVIRFCKSVGFEGFPEMKIALAMENTKNEELNFNPYVSKDDKEEEVLKKIFSANVKALRDTLEGVDKKAFKKAISLINSAEKIFIYGIGTSAFLANEFQYRLLLLGYNAHVFTDAVKMRTASIIIGKNDLVIGISHTGRTSFVCDSVKCAKDNGAKTLCITSIEKSTLYDMCDVGLVTTSDEINYPVEALSARIAQLSLLESITAAVSLKSYEDANDKMLKCHEVVNTMRYKPKK
ncbi:MAG: MurR/RpiR family transcriptional regulator [Ruminococcaceae bacterium]|nr:MurR/RpiR family transcriptional regulator [Oscillospiraceae bacterium]